MVLDLNRVRSTTQENVIVDQGLRSYMLKVYNYMASAILVTALTSLFVSTSPVMINLIFNTPLKFVIMFAPLVMVFFFAPAIRKMGAGAGFVMLLIFSVLMGASLSSIFLVFTATSVARVFFITAAMFGALSIYGYTTKKDLSGMATFLFMALIGLVIASIVNMFLSSTGLQFLISVVGVIVFAGLTAYDTQKIKDEYYLANQESLGGLAVMSALTLYLDFINLFIMLMQLLGDRRN